MSNYTDSLRTQGLLDEQATRILSAANIQSPEELHSLLLTFPTLGNVGINMAILSNHAARTASAAYMAVAGPGAFAPSRVGFGAEPPSTTTWSPGTSVPIPPPAPAPLPAPAAPITTPTPVVPPLWPVRDQGARGTCVAHGAAAVLEQTLGRADLSEQFLYWAIKDRHDPNRMRDGTWLSYASAALAAEGICDEVDWPYNPAAVVGHQGDPPPPPAAPARAALTTATLIHSSLSNASKIYTALQSNPVAISLPVFASSGAPTNWTSPVGWLSGTVLNPPATAVVVSGHCVCLVGFVPDPTEPAGGWFILRNSWGVGWGSQGASAPTPRCPAAGYGSVSATYVDLFTWEWAAL